MRVVDELNIETFSCDSRLSVSWFLVTSYRRKGRLVRLLVAARYVSDAEIALSCERP